MKKLKNKIIFMNSIIAIFIAVAIAIICITDLSKKMFNQLSNMKFPLERTMIEKLNIK